MTSSYADIKLAAARIKGLVDRTPVLTSDQLNQATGVSLFFKAEHLQKSGAFKARGAVNAVCSLESGQLINGIATHSSGNHGTALARVGMLFKIPTYVVVPSNALQIKKDVIAAYGARIIECEPTLASRETTLSRVVADTGATFVHPYDDNKIIAGAGTAALEFVEQVKGLDVIMTPIGGGGLLSGASLVAEAEEISVYGAEPSGADDASRSLQSGELVMAHEPDTICDGLLTTVGARNWEVIRHRVKDIFTVADQDTLNAMYLVWTRMKQIVEPSAAVPLAAALKYRDLFKDQRVGLILTGGNVDPRVLDFQVRDDLGHLS